MQTALERALCWLRDPPEDAALPRLWVADRDALRARLEPVLDEPPPSALVQAVLGGDPTSVGSASPGPGMATDADATAMPALPNAHVIPDALPAGVGQRHLPAG